MTVSQQISPSALRAYKLSKYANGQPGKLLLEAKKVKRATSQFMSRNGAKEASKRMKALKKTATTTKKVADGVKKIQDLFLKKIPGTGDSDKATKASGLVALLAAIGITALLKLQEFVADRTFDNLTALSNDLSKNLTLLTTVNSKVKNLNEKVDKFNAKISKELDANAKDYARLNKSVEKTGQEVVAAKKQANDALYETREGRKIVGGLAEAARKLANEALYEARANKQNLDAQVIGLRTTFDTRIQAINSQIANFTSRANDSFQNAINSTIAKIQASLTSTQSELRAVQSQISVIKSQPPVDTNAIVSRAVAVSRTEIAPVQAQATAAQATATAAMQQVATALPALTAAIPNLASAIQSASAGIARAEGKSDLALSAANANKSESEKLEDSFKKQVEANNKALEVRDLTQSKLSQDFDRRLNEISKDFDIASAALNEKRWQDVLQSQEEWLSNSYKIEKSVVQIQLDFKSSFGDMKFQLADATSKNQQAIQDTKNDLNQQIQNSENRTNDKINSLATTTNKSLDTLGKELQQQRDEFEQIADENAKIAQGDTKLAEQKWDRTVKELEKTFDKKQDNSEKRLGERIDQETLERKREDKKIVNQLGGQISDIQQQIDNPTVPTEIPQFQRDLQQIKQDLTKIKPDIKDLQKRTKEQEKVNALALPKLDQILGLVGLIPAIPARAAGFINPNIPTLPQIENATGTAMCRNLRTGCGRQAIDDAVGNVTGNSNTNSANIMNAINTGLNGANLGANAALLQGQQTILSRLGDQVPGGISGFMNRIVKNQWVDRAINLITMTAAVHNVMMLSDQAVTTFFSILDNVLAVPALIIDPNAETIDTKQAFGGVIDNFFKNIFGVAEWAEIKTKWATANRIYQAAANGANEVRSIGGNIISAVEQTARLTGKGFNALQDEGLISENNWDYSPENLKLKGGLFAKFGKLADGINIATEGLEAIESITSEVRSAVDSANQIKENAKEVDDGLKELFNQSKTKREEEIEALPAKSYSWEDLI
ncbi:hypothetical protein [Nostoc sp. 2RC]|uniref:hypothetical protein n=1 Tax=Nostoc sp. 2RC TaxID=2485484 RepID=UPI0016269F01|nr:hypothetical protein [Nostoc sp. 2RC]MBC1238708.1 hypothetical protein [Nostoc sp. 2RC]